MQTGADPRAAVRRGPVRLELDVQESPDDWILEDEQVPESIPHREANDELEDVLSAHIERTGADAYVAVNLACRWDESNPRVGVDPDVALLVPAPKNPDEVDSLLTWQPDSPPPPLAFEIVSRSTAPKDYVEAPAKYARLGTRELVVFDPHRRGPLGLGGPVLLQVWRLHDEGRRMTRVYAGEGPARSAVLDAWLVVTDGGRRLRIADDPMGHSLWLTKAESEAAEKQRALEGQQRALEDKQRALEDKQRALEDKQRALEDKQRALEDKRRTEEAARAALRSAVEDICDFARIPLDEGRRAELAGLDLSGLETLRAHLRNHRAWPA